MRILHRLANLLLGPEPDEAVASELPEESVCLDQVDILEVAGMANREPPDSDGSESHVVNLATSCHRRVLIAVADLCRVELGELPSTSGGVAGRYSVRGSPEDMALFWEAWSAHSRCLDRALYGVTRAWLQACFPSMADRLASEDDEDWRKADYRAAPRSGDPSAMRKHLARLHDLRGLQTRMEAGLVEALRPMAERRAWGTPAELRKGSEPAPPEA